MEAGTTRGPQHALSQEARRLLEWVRYNEPAGPAGCLICLAVYWSTGAAFALLILASVAINWVLVVRARRLLQKDRIEPAVLSISEGMWAIALVIWLTIPVAWGLAAIIGLMPIVMAAAYIRRQFVLPMMAASVGVAALGAIAYPFRPLFDTSMVPDAVFVALVVFFAPALTASSALAVWHSISRLLETLDEAREANEALAESEASLERKVVERTAELQTAVGRLEQANAELEASIAERKRMAAELDKARLRMEDELNVGREIQMSMLPLTFPPYPRRSEFDVFAVLEPAREVGGDFYDFFLIDDDHFCVCVGDVSGKGVPAALFMAVTKTLIKSRASTDYSPASILTHVNTEISDHNEASMFVTIFLGILNLDSGELRYSNAGHNPPYVRRVSGELLRLDQRHGPVIGALDGLVYKQDSIVLEPDELLFVYTDGVTEAMNRDGDLYEESRLAEVLRSSAPGAPGPPVAATLLDVREFQGAAEQADDITILAATYQGKAGAESRVVELVLTNRADEIARANAEFNAFAESEGLPDTIRRSINLVLDELVSNIIAYAFEDAQEHAIELRFELSRTRLSVTLVDDGVPFNPFAGSPPDTALSLEQREMGGLGIHLVRSLMDEVTYNRRTQSNVVILVKYLEQEGGQ